MRRAVAKKNAESGEWRTVPGQDGISTLLLNKDDETQGSTRLVKLRKGHEVERSLHDGTVEVFVLEGQWQVGPITYGPGDYFCVPGGVVHGPERALTDVRFLVTAHGPLTPGP